MPIYLNTKQIVSIPPDSDLDLSDNDTFLKDPDMLYDRLPKPFYFINKIITKIVNDAFCIINENNNRKISETSGTQPQNIFMTSASEDLGNIRCMCEVCPKLNYIAVGLNDCVGVIDIVSGVFIDKLEMNDVDVIFIDCQQLFDNIFIITTIDNNGSGKLFSFTYNKLFNLKTFAGNKDSDKPCQVTSLTLSENCELVAVSYDNFKKNDQWLEIHKISREAWIKEIDSASRSSEEPNIGRTRISQSPDQSSIALDRNDIRLTPTKIILKMKFPDTLSSVSINNVNQLSKQIDSSGSTFGLGFNHCLSADYVEKMNNVFKKNNTDFVDSVSSINSVSHLMRIANVRFSNAGRPMGSQSESSDTESSLIFVWWSQSQHLLIYGSNKPNQKNIGDTWAKPDSVKSFSCYIMACEISTNKSFLGIGLQNGMFILLDIVSGLTCSIKQISDCSIHSIRHLYFEDHSGDINKVYFSIVDSKSRMFCLVYDPFSQLNDSAVVLVSKDTSSDYIGRISKFKDLALSVLHPNVVVILDMVTGMKLFNVNLPKQMSLLSPWQPILGFSSKSGHLYVQVIEDNEESQNRKSVTITYKLELESPSQEVQDNSSSKPIFSETNISVNILIANMLQKRYSGHHDRQKALQRCWNELEDVLLSIS